MASRNSLAVDVGLAQAISRYKAEPAMPGHEA